MLTSGQVRVQLAYTEQNALSVSYNESFPAQRQVRRTGFNDSVFYCSSHI